MITLNETILNVFWNYVPNKYITNDDKDTLWMNNTIKSRNKTVNKLCKEYNENGISENEIVFIKTLITKVNDLITSTKLAKRLNNPVL